MIHDLLTCGWEEIAAFPKDSFVVFCGIAPIEEHGKHLPVGVDVYETQHWIRMAAEELDRKLPGYHWGILPVIPLGFAQIGQFPGNIHVSRKLVYDVVYETIRAISGWEVRHMVVISGHADLYHTIAIERACDQLNAEKGLTAMAPMGAIFCSDQTPEADGLPEMLREKERHFPNDFHAGWIETSCMMDIAPQLVKENYKLRPDVSVDGRDMADGQKIARITEGEGHIGYPKEAGRELGAALNESTAKQIADAVSRFVAGHGYECYQHHPLYHILKDR